ncbi:MAG TPA: GGDEF domain-containing protein, partial [bacterium]|nr:GGDEF domain-containing protein [bacterium]
MGRKNRDTEIRRGLFGLGAKFTPEAKAAEKTNEDLSFDLLNLPIRFFFSPPSLGTEAEEILTSRFGMLKFTLRLDEERIDPLLAESKVISQKQLTGAGPHNDSCPFATGKPLIAIETTPYNLCSPCAVDSEIGKPMMRIPLICAENVCGALTLNLERLPSELEHPEFTHAFLRLVNDAFEVGMLREANRLLEITDSLTRVHNYRYFIKAIEQELERSRRYDHPFSIVVFDIDEFKSFNDRHGYSAGDLILKETAATIRRC